MKLTVDQMLQLVNERFLREPDDFGRKSILRRLARLRGGYGRWGEMQVDIPKPAMSDEAKALLGNSPRAEPGPSKVKEEEADEPEPVVVTTRRSTRGRLSAADTEEV